MNMYALFLTLHSATRWLVLFTLIMSIINAFLGWKRRQAFGRSDNMIRVATHTVAHLQLGLGIVLYFLSPIVSYFLNHFSEAVHQREQRFFGMEHIVMMVLAVTLITYGSVIAKRRTTDEGKFRAMATWFTVGFIIIFLSIPWSFSPFTARPLLRF